MYGRCCYAGKSRVVRRAKSSYCCYSIEAVPCQIIFAEQNKSESSTPSLIDFSRTTAEFFPFVFSSANLACDTSTSVSYYTGAQSAVRRQSQRAIRISRPKASEQGIQTYTHISKLAFFTSHDAFTTATQGRPPRGENNHGPLSAAPIASLLLDILAHSSPRQLLR